MRNIELMRLTTAIEAAPNADLLLKLFADGTLCALLEGYYSLSEELHQANKEIGDLKDTVDELEDELKDRPTADYMKDLEKQVILLQEEVASLEDKLEDLRP